jgi:hypothetical protein
MSAVSWEMLFNSMEERWRPEDVAALAAQLQPELRPTLKPALRSSWFGKVYFDNHGRPGFRGHSINTSITKRFPGLPTDPAAAVEFLREQTGLVSSDLRNRMPAPLRKAMGITISRRQYMKRCRIQLALERKLGRVVERGAFVRWTRLALSGWAMDIASADFMSLTPMTRVFVAYYVARKQRQSVFSGSGQDPAWDQVAERLFALAVPNRTVALAFPDTRVLRHLTDAQRTELLVQSYRDLRDMAVVMAELWDILGADRNKMIVQRGMNSSDWNAIAGAWNSVRAMWIELLHVCGRQSDLLNFCPGKAMRLMAADVAAWHQMRGGDEGPDVKVFKQLPLPWDVVVGRAICKLSMVQDACRVAGVETGSWTAPRTVGDAVATKPTHALVHGVAVSDPGLADVLRRAGWFSGKPKAKPVQSVGVKRDEYGFAEIATLADG